MCPITWKHALYFLINFFPTLSRPVFVPPLVRGERSAGSFPEQRLVVLLSVKDTTRKAIGLFYCGVSYILCFHVTSSFSKLKITMSFLSFKIAWQYHEILRGRSLRSVYCPRTISSATERFRKIRLAWSPLFSDGTNENCVSGNVLLTLSCLGCFTRASII